MQTKENIQNIAPYQPGVLKEGAIKMASNENPLGSSPRALAVIQQRLDKLHLYPDGGCVRIKAALAKHYGLTPEHFLIGNGSEVSTLIEAAKLLKSKQGMKIHIVSVPSEGLFRNQSKEYQQEVLPPDFPKFGLTAGLPVTLEGLTGDYGMVAGLEHFGYSAPYKVLDKEFGFTDEAVYNKVIEYLREK